MINLNKNTEVILKSQRDQNIAKERHLWKKDHRNKVWYNNFEDLVNFQHDNGGRTDVKCRKNKKLIYWVKNQSKFYRQLLQDEHTPPTPERKSVLENIGFVWTIEKGSAGKGPIHKKKIPDD